MKRYYLKDGFVYHEPNQEKALKLKGQPIASEYVGDTFIRTDFLSLDINAECKGDVPLLFETEVLPNGDWDLVYWETYYNLEDAEKGHKKIVARYKRKLRNEKQT